MYKYNLAEAEADNLLPIDDQNPLPSQISSFENDERIEIDDDDERIEDVDGDDGESIDEDESIDDDDNELSNNSDESENSSGDIDNFHDGSYIAALDDLNGNNKQETVTWPSQTYKEFMTAITQYRISDAAGDAMLQIIKKNCTEPLPASTRKGQLYMDTMNIKGLHLKTQDLVKFEGITYKLHYRPIIDAIKSLTSNQELCKEFFLDYKEEWESRDDGTLMRVYSEQNTAEWWRERESPFSKILAVMLYIDGTTLDTYGQHSEYPVFLTLANIPNWRRNLPDAKVFVCFLPQLSTRDGKLRESKKFKQYKRNLEQRALKYLLSPLIQKEGIYLAINGKVEHFIPHISTILADMSEAQSICCTYKSYCTTCPCYKCLIPGDQLNNMHVNVNSIILRTHENMSAVVLSHDAAKYSIHEHENFFWKFRMMNIYDVVALDRMHLQEIGLFPYMLDFTREMIMYQSGNQIITKMDVR
ncbi:unnamed protein product [Rhizophagus irregularis]|nr:unnamed protein product [Rhizophagus irregularis]